eukprot:5963920-Prymnesium_polylepis.1
MRGLLGSRRVPSAQRADPPARVSRRCFKCRRVVRGVLGGLVHQSGRNVRRGEREVVRRGRGARRGACAC